MPNRRYHAGTGVARAPSRSPFDPLPFSSSRGEKRKRALGGKAAGNALDSFVSPSP
jgi:hypothetical protein